VGQRRRRPVPARARQPGRPASTPDAERVPAGAAAPAASPAIAPAGKPRRVRRDGVVVPLRPPWTTRLRATFGLVFMVAFLGAATAVLVAAVAIAAAQALSRF
jgi:hypothetical protein